MFKFLCFSVCYILSYHLLNADVTEDTVKGSTVVIAILARNKAHTLPYFLSILEKLTYPKNRVSLWIRSDHNSDKTIEILKLWINSVKNDYHSIESVFDQDSPSQYPGEIGPAHWPPERFNQMIKLREEALQYARQKWADYIMFLDCDVFFVNMNVLQDLISKNLAVTAPMLKSDGLYSNFWAGMTPGYYYSRTDEYKPLLNRESPGCHAVPMVHSCVLVDLRRTLSERLAFMPDRVVGYHGPHDDIITFALSANLSGIDLHVCNDLVHGFVSVPLEQGDPLENDFQQLVNIKLEVMNEHEPLPLSDLLQGYVQYPPRDTLGFDTIFMINLKRRPERRERMKHVFRELGLQVEVRDAVDGSQLNDTLLETIDFLPEYEDPYHKRPMKLGEIGCFLSHHEIWKEMSSRGLDTVLVLEDDIRFEPFFRLKALRLQQELRGVEWDLVYLGRKPMGRYTDQDRGDEAAAEAADHEPWVQGSTMLVHAGYSYWTLGYVISSLGASKLLEAEPLGRLLPVDEFLPVMSDQHPRSEWKRWFPHRDLVVLSAAPLLLYPTHYTGEEGYVSDTEDSNIIPDDIPLHTDL